MNVPPSRRTLGLKEFILLTLSAAVVALGQPAALWWCAPIAALCGYAPLFVFLVQWTPSLRSTVAFIWCFIVQSIQLAWMVSHPYSYIWIVYISFSLLIAGTFSFFAWWVDRRALSSFRGILWLSSLWTLLEWARLFFLSGFSWNPSGLALSALLPTMQFAALGGVYLLSFWVCTTNLLLAALWLQISSSNDRSPSERHQTTARSTSLYLLIAITPYLYGGAVLAYHLPRMAADPRTIRALLVQTAFPAEEPLPFASFGGFIAFVEKEWETIFRLVRPYQGKEIDLIVLPEAAVPLGTYNFSYRYESVVNVLQTLFGPEIRDQLPEKKLPLAQEIRTAWMVNNAFWSQSLANLLRAPVVIGLEDADQLPDGEYRAYSAALYFEPTVTSPSQLLLPNSEKNEERTQRYEKRILVPMGEYIPFQWCRSLARAYGITGSLQPGCNAKQFGQVIPFSPSICYEETFGSLVREGCTQGAQFLVNMTSDVWYPDSLLPRQHLEHARLRTVENGVPLLRACNTGITCAIDSLGRNVSYLTDAHGNTEWVADAHYTTVSLYNYNTPYKLLGDGPVIGGTLAGLLLGFRYRRRYS